MIPKTPFFQKISTKIAAISTIVAVFFVLMVFGVLLPVMEQELMKSRRDSLRALVDVAYNLLNEYDQRVQEGEFSVSEAERRFIARIKSMRFKNHDYFWVQDDALPYPTMIVHPADPSLEGKVVDFERFNKTFAMQFGDNGPVVRIPGRNKHILQAATEVAVAGGGFISYDWPKPTAEGLTKEYYPKQSYVKHFQPWGWVIGTGLYFDDIKADMARLRWSIFSVAFVLFGLIAFMTVVVLRNITRPLGALMRYSGEVARGDLDAVVAGKVTGEFSHLKASTEAMVQALRRSLQDAQVKKEEALREAEKSKQAERALRQSEERFQLVMDATQDGIWDWDVLAERDNYFSPGYYMMLGYTPGEFPMNSQAWSELIHPEDREMVLRMNQDCIEGRCEDFKTVYRMRGKDGQWHWILGRGKAVVRDETGRALRLVGSHVDISEAKQAEEERQRLLEQLLQAQKMEAVGNLAGGVAHDFNNLLQAIGGHVQLMLARTSPDEPDHDRLRTICRAVERGGQLVQRLLLFGRKVQPQHRPVDLNQEAREASQILERSILRMVTIELRLANELWPVNADPVQIEQVFINLGVNAADAMPDGGRLTIATENVELGQGGLPECPDIPPGRYVLLTVADTGIGMSADVLERIYEPFFTTKEVGKGTGLGLSSVYGIVQSHGGCILCESEVGQGTVFRIYLPALKEGTALAQPAASTQPLDQIPAGDREIILVVDDEADLRDLTVEALYGFGYDSLVASSGQEALDIYAAHKGRISLVLLDLNMPKMSGQHCLRELLRMDPGVKVLVVSGNAVSSKIDKILRDGAVGFLAKPYQLEELLTKIREMLDQRQA